LQIRQETEHCEMFLPLTDLLDIPQGLLVYYIFLSQICIGVGIGIDCNTEPLIIIGSRNSYIELPMREHSVFRYTPTFCNV
jgi:hypothetical protein